MGFFDELCDRNAAAHERTLAHPIVRAIGSGSVGDGRFRFYLGQDYQFLRQYIRVIARAVAAAESDDDLAWLTDLLHATVASEMAGVADLYGRFGGDPGAIRCVGAHPACRGYTDHLLARSAEGDLLLILASLLPCQWGYREIARSLCQGMLTGDERYRAWIGDYASEAYGELVDRMIGSLDRLSQAAGRRALDRAHEVFAASMDHELRFWDMVAEAPAA